MPTGPGHDLEPCQGPCPEPWRVGAPTRLLSTGSRQCMLVGPMAKVRAECISRFTIDSLSTSRHSGFSVDASQRVAAGEEARFERLVRYATRVPLAAQVGNRCARRARRRFWAQGARSGIRWKP